MIVRTRSYPRAGLVGNPSDGYHGKTIAFLFRNFHAEVTLWETPELEILPNARDGSRFDNIEALAQDVRSFGYYGGIRLLKATVMRFYDYCQDNAIALEQKNFTLRYSSTIPHHVGLAGSSAIVTACLRALCAFYGVTIPTPTTPNLVLAVENEELGIGAGLQDRVVQTYEGLVYMDFDRALFERQGYGLYERLDPALLPPLYIAYDDRLAQGSEVVHNNLRERYNRGDAAVLDAIKFWAELTDRVRDCLKRGEKEKVGALLNANFDRRRQLYDVGERNIAMIEAARSVGAAAKFTGSGGAIVGTYTDEAMYQRLEAKFEEMGVAILKPDIA